MAHPVLRTERLLLRPFSLADASRVQRLAGDAEVARGTSSIPHPYPDGEAERWIRSLEEYFQRGTAVHFAIERRSDESLMGAIGLRIEQEHARAELGYWIGAPFWGHGYCTEAAREVVNYGFSRGDLRRICAHHLVVNPASGRVLQKIGMTQEDRKERHAPKADDFLDTERYRILRDEWALLKRGANT